MNRVLSILCVILFALEVYSQPYYVGHKQFNFVDPARNRTIQTEVYYPATANGDNTPFANGAFPLLVFGHGFMMSWDAYRWYWDSLVPRGYIMAFPRTEMGIPPNHGAFGEDLRFLNNHIKNEGNNPSSFFYQHISGTSAIMGHSMGGGSSVLAASNNNNITALINFAAAETNPSAKNAALTVTVPTLMFYGHNDGVTKPSENQIPIFNNIAADCKTLIGIIGGGHCYFANPNSNCSLGESTTSPQPTITREQQQKIVARFLFPYLDYVLKGNTSSKNLFYQLLNTDNSITYQNVCTFQNDVSLTSFVSPSNSCGLSNTQQVSVIIKNNGENPVSNIPVTLVFNQQTPISEICNSVITPGDSIIYTFNTMVNAGQPGGNYSFVVYTSYPNDEYPYNDTIKLNLTNTSVALPLSVDFTGFDGGNLSTVFPGWREAQGIVPTGTSSIWVSRTGLGNSSNTTAKVNFYNSPIREWILGPGFLCTNYTKLRFDVAVTAYNSNNAYPNGMGTNDSLRIFYSLDCGNTWRRLISFGRNSGFTNVLQTKEIDLSQFAGQGIAIAFQAFRENSSANDYDLHIDNILIKNDYPYDLELLQISQPVVKECYSDEQVEIILKNKGLNNIDFNQNNALITVSATNGYISHYTLNTGTLNSGASMYIVVDTIDMTQGGSYQINVKVHFAQDNDTTNNSTSRTYQVTNPVVSISGNNNICAGQQTTLTAHASAYGTVINMNFNNTSMNIPDNIANGVISEINMSSLPSNLPASSVKQIIIDTIIHSYVGDLRIDIIAPDNSTTNLVNKRGGTGDNFIGTIFDMSASTNISNITQYDAPYTGVYRPEGNFNSLTGIAKGVWKLKVADLGIGDVGTLKKWSIKFEYQNAIITYTWNSGQTTMSININPTQSEQYIVTVTDMKGCSATSNIMINVSNDLPNVELGNDTSICQGGYIYLSAPSGYLSYLWNNGATTNSIIVSNGGTYHVTVSNYCGAVSDSIVVQELPLPNINLGTDTTICEGQSLVLDAGIHNTYQWSNSLTTQTINVTPTVGIHTYSVTVTNAYGCANSDEISVVVSVCTDVMENSKDIFVVYEKSVNKYTLILKNADNSEISLYSSTGQLMLRKMIYDNNIEIDLSNFAKGLYYLIVNNNNDYSKVIKLSLY